MGIRTETGMRMGMSDVGDGGGCAPISGMCAVANTYAKRWKRSTTTPP